MATGSWSSATSPSNHAYNRCEVLPVRGRPGWGLPNYPLARIGLVQALNEEVTAQAEPAQEDLIRLRDEYRRTLMSLDACQAP